MIEVRITGEPKEIAAFLCGVEKRPKDEIIDCVEAHFQTLADKISHGLRFSLANSATTKA